MNASKRLTLDIFDAARLASTHDINSFLEALDYSVAILESVELTSGVYGPVVVVALRSMPKVN